MSLPTATTPLWSPSAAQRQSTRIFQFQQLIEKKYQQSFDNYASLQQWSIDHLEEFWAEAWEFLSIRHSSGYDSVLEHSEKFPGARWFSGSRLNFAENLLCPTDVSHSNNPAIVSLLENGVRKELSRSQLFDAVERLASALRSQGIVKGDRVVGFMPNIAETVIAMLATTSIGAIWSSCSPDFGINGVVDRFGQIEPKVLFAADGYYYNGKTIQCLPQLEKVCEKIASIEKVVIIPLTQSSPDLSTLNSDRGDYAVLFEDFATANNVAPLQFEQLPFDHPLYIMYSSGTTGVPKCIVHSAGGTLVQQVKELKLHTDLGPEDVLFYFTTCGWMMWNWLVAGLACGGTIVLYDGTPFAKDEEDKLLLLNAIDDEGITHFGTSAKFIATLEKENITPAKTHKLTTLRTILSTGSPLSHESFDYVYREIKSDLCLASICGGTDIVSCFLLGNPALPVYQGELQCRGLGMSVEIWNDEGQAVLEEKGELVCTRPIPCCPIGFWNDPNDAKFHQAYFAAYDNIWAHGDYGEVTANGGFIIHGRSDAVLNPGGVRIGTAEIYRQVEKIEAVVDSVVVGQQWENDVRVVLFVVLREALDNAAFERLSAQIKATIRSNTTPRHVPAKIIPVAEVPRTISGKIVELAVRNVIHNEPVNNADALANPEALECYRNLEELR